MTQPISNTLDPQKSCRCCWLFYNYHFSTLPTAQSSSFSSLVSLVASLAYSCVCPTPYSLPYRLHLLAPACLCLCLTSITSLALSSYPFPALSYHLPPLSPFPFLFFFPSSTVLLLTVDPILFFVFITREKGTKAKARPGVQVFFLRYTKKEERVAKRRGKKKEGEIEMDDG